MTVVLDDSCPGWQLFWVAAVLGGSCSGASCPRWQLF